MSANVRPTTRNQDRTIIVLPNDDGKKMAERDGLVPFLDETRMSLASGWRHWLYRGSTVLVVQLIGAHGDEMFEYMDGEIIGEMASTGFCEIWIANCSPIEPYGTVQLFGIKPARWRRSHRHRFVRTETIRMKP